MFNNKAETTFQSMAISLILFCIIIIGGVYVINDSFQSYGITDTNDLNTSDYLSLQNNITNLVDNAEKDDINKNIVGKALDAIDVLGIQDALNQISGMRSIILNVKHLITNLLNFVPTWIWALFFGILFIIIVTLSIRAWLKLTP